MVPANFLVKKLVEGRELVTAITRIIQTFTLTTKLTKQFTKLVMYHFKNVIQQMTQVS